MPAPQELIRLIDRFDEHLDDYRRGRFNETQLRRDYLDPFFEILGWDVANKKGYAEAYREVIHEDAIRIDNTIKAPDYTFRIGGDRKYFVEAKKPGVNIKDDIAPAYQVRRYAWSAKLPLSLLTDFEEWAVYDTRIKPDRLDRSTVARIQYFKYSELPERWDEFEGVFSREAILRGSFDKYAQSAKTKRGTTEVDDAFLAEIDDWRDLLAQNLALRNPELSQRDLNFAVQRTIDRIIFLRICEDRGIEEYGRLRDLKEGKGVYERLVQMYHQADARYNSGLFHFRREKGEAETPDLLTPDLKIDDRVLHEIARRLYYPDSPYEFSVFSSSILGHVYERFLGKVIVLDKKHKATVEEKPEVRKAGGVYYTPDYISKYIVENTVGKLVEDKEPKDVAEVRVLDPACGSGSFLLAAYDFLLDWHLRYYLDNDPEAFGRKKNAPIFRVVGHDGSESWRLTTSEKRRILLNNIHGVDIDQQAVEVTKLSLLLKVLEGESEQTLGSQMALLHQRVLPDLGNNIKNGNSLIGPEFYDERDYDEFTDEERARINAFDWKREFPQIMRGGGFHAIIGNPPYIRIQAMKEWAPIEVDHYKASFASAKKGNYDVYVVFIERSLDLLSPSGALGFIVPNKFFNAQYGEPVRTLLTEGRHVSGIVHFGHQQVFSGATTYTCLLFLSKTSKDVIEFGRVTDLTKWATERVTEHEIVPSARLGSAEWNINTGKKAVLTERLSAEFPKLGDAAAVFVGLQTSADDVYVMSVVEEHRERLRLHSKALGGEVEIERGLLHPLVSGTDVKRFEPLPSRQYILFPYEVHDESARLIPMGTIKRRWPLTAKYLAKNKDRLAGRERGKFDDEEWYRFGRSQNLGIQSRAKICVPRLVPHLYATIDRRGGWFLDNVDVGGVTLKEDAFAEESALLFMLGLLNSRLLRWFFPSVSAPFRGGYMSANRQFLSQLPIVPFNNVVNTEHWTSVIRLVEQNLGLHERVTRAKTAHDRAVIIRERDGVDRRLNAAVYAVYGLSRAEIELVEDGEA